MFIIDEIASLDPTHDSSVAMMEAAQLLGHYVYITTIERLSVVEGKGHAYVSPVTLKPVQRVDDHWQAERDWYSLGDWQFVPIESFDAVLMRKDPPVTTSYLYATYILDLVNPKNTKVINSPRGIRAANEKMYALQFTSVIPDTIVTQDKQLIRDFLQKKGKVVIKPLGGKAGEGILLLEREDKNFNSLIEISTKKGLEPIMVQEYLPASSQGDKRIIIVNGKPVGAVNRIPNKGDFRGNMAVGGTVAPAKITPRDWEICQVLRPRLLQDGLFFVGIDVIGGYLTEVNVTSPTGIREIDLLSHSSLGELTVREIENFCLDNG